MAQGRQDIEKTMQGTMRNLMEMSDDGENYEQEESEEESEEEATTEQAVAHRSGTSSRATAAAPA